MTATLLLDTGPLVSMLSPREPRHAWSREVVRVRARVVTCEAVVSEAFFLLRGHEVGAQGLRNMLTAGDLLLAGLGSEMRQVMALMNRYLSVPMSYADACLVRLSETVPQSVVATLDADFKVYRRNGRQVIPLLTP